MLRKQTKSHSPIIITAGEPAGIGPDLIVQLAQEDCLVDSVVIADPKLLQERAKLLKLPLVIEDYAAGTFSHKKSHVVVLPIATPYAVQAGILDSHNSSYVLETLKRAAEGCLTGEFSALVTGPINKGIINQAGIKFVGHTEFLARAADVELTVMMLQNKFCRVASVTTHLPLRFVADAINGKLLDQIIVTLHCDLQKYFKIKNPRILVCGLNPHAGEGGYLGREEVEIINPALDKLRQKGMQIIGPVSADTAFIPQNLQQSDVILCMYHDQGLPALKALGFEDAVNITLGLPFIRTSVDHGTAIELAGTGKASYHSLWAALRMAAELIN